MSNSRFEPIQAFSAPLYAVAALLVVLPAIDFLTGILPLRADNIEWRFASVGLLSGFVLTPMLGIVLGMLVAVSTGHVAVQRALAIYCVVFAVVLAVLLPPFILDIVQLRQSVPEEARATFRMSATRALGKHVAFVFVLGWVGKRGLRLSRVPASASRRPAAIVIGT